MQRDSNAFLQGTIVDVVGNSSNDSIASGIIALNYSELKIEEMIGSRIEAKKSKNFAEADAIRKQLADAGVILEDTPQGTTWRRA